MSETAIVKVQTSADGGPLVLVYAKGRRHVRQEPMPKLAAEMGPLCKRFYHATITGTGYWTLGQRAPDQEW